MTLEFVRGRWVFLGTIIPETAFAKKIQFVRGPLRLVASRVGNPEELGRQSARTITCASTKNDELLDDYIRTTGKIDRAGSRFAIGRHGSVGLRLLITPTLLGEVEFRAECVKLEDLPDLSNDDTEVVVG
ncbi:Uu.00g037830.m01.CDS01 [Anthostomella pinea]|uniref:Uu.00g037830.m01.CDS01 n=1 Tax=Anthostomella pinea TaxID=933095 RepID=A0AAI8V9P2_9PEZI|nr:Uu.00g037830.m01.CDS01 [Anthostomella pinea]